MFCKERVANVECTAVFELLPNKTGSYTGVPAVPLVNQLFE